MVERLKVLSLNIWNRQGPWDERLPLIRAGIAELDPDLIGLQEVLAMRDVAEDAEPASRSQAHEIADGAYQHVALFPALEIGGGLTFGNALLSRWPIVETSLLHLPPDTGTEKRCCGYALVDAPCGRVPVFVTHLSWKLHEGHLRVLQVEAITAEVKQRAPMTGFPPILMGDFNADPDADEMRYLRGLTGLGGKTVYFADCWSYGGQGQGFTYARDNPYALRAREPSRRIDYIYVRGPDRQLRGEPLHARVVLDRPTAGVYPSDHYGIYAEIQATPRPHDPF